MIKLLLIFSLYCLATKFSPIKAQTSTDSVVFAKTDTSYIRYTTTYQTCQYADGDSLVAKSNSTKRKVIVSPLSLPVSTAQSTSIGLKLNKTDTAAMLTPYYRSSDAAATYATITNLALKAPLSSPTITGTAALPIVTMTGKITSYNSISTVSNGIPSIVATIDLTAQAASIGTTTLYAVPSAGFYRVSVYITITQAATTSSTMPNTTIAYTDGNSGTNAHSTVTTATNASNSITTSFAQATYVLYAKASTNITYAAASYASSGGTPMQFALRIRVENL